MTRGNQRELARAKNSKNKQQAAKTASQKGGQSLEERKHRDAEIMRQKQEKSKGDTASGGDSK